VDRIKYIHEEPEKNTAEIPAQENRGRIDLSYLREDRENMPAASVVAQAVSVMAPRGTPQSEMQSTQEIKRKRVRPVVGVSSPRASRVRKTASSEGPLAENKELP